SSLPRPLSAAAKSEHRNSKNVDQPPTASTTNARHANASAVSSVTDEKQQQQQQQQQLSQATAHGPLTPHSTGDTAVPDEGAVGHGSLGTQQVVDKPRECPFSGADAPSPTSATSSAATDQPQATGASDAMGNDLQPPTTATTTATAATSTSNSKLSSIHEHPPPPTSADRQHPPEQQIQDQEQRHQKQQRPLPSPAVTPGILSLRPAANVAFTASAQPAVHTPVPRHQLAVSDDSPASLVPTPAATLAASPSLSRPANLIRRQSLLSSRQTALIRTLLTNGQAGDDADYAQAEQLIPINPAMVSRKIWVKRPGASATLVTINEDDLVDDVRDMILRKYANSLGRQFDAPDLTIRIKPREQLQERTLGPEEPMSRTIDAYFPGGQSVDEALIIDVPLRRTPRASPRAGPPHAPHIASVYYASDDSRPSEAAGDYFGPGALSTVHVPVTVTAASTGSNHQHSISVLNTGQVPQIPSPGGTRSRAYRDRPERPRLGRQHTSSPTILNIAGGAHQGSIAAATSGHDHSAQAPAPPPLPTPPAPAPDPSTIQRVATPPPRVASPRPTASARPKKKKNADHPSLPTGMLNGTVPPINVLIVEDNIINLKLLEAFVKRLKVRWQMAMNGRDAVNKWRNGGFHLVLMDIQLPVMSGLDATREIR
ncbi:Response regulator mcs4, partial [Pleurostoma richardsiae]